VINIRREKKQGGFMKKLFVLSMLLFVIFTISACEPREAVTMEMMWFSDGVEGEVMQALLDRYFEETGVEIELLVIGWNEYETRLGQMIDGGDQPALIRTTEGVMNNFKTHLVELDGVFVEENFTNIFYNAVNKPLGLPMDVTANGLYVNLDLLNKYEVNYPMLGDEDIWTWAEFEVEMNKLRDKSDVNNPGLFDFQGHRFMPLIYQHGVHIWEDAFTETNLTGEGAQAALQLLMDFYDNGLISKEVFSTNAAELFESGRYGFHMSGNWFAGRYHNADLDFEWTVVPMPTGPEGQRATVLGGKSMSALKGSGNEAEAKAFITWLAEAEQHDEYTSYVPFLSARIGAEIDFGDLAHALNVFQDEINNTPVSFVSDWLLMTQVPGIYPMINLMTNRASAGEMTALEILQALETTILAAMNPA
jgi:alpha-1,4-digalacturonate transport system substrate-binding protein